MENLLLKFKKNLVLENPLLYFIYPNRKTTHSLPLGEKFRKQIFIKSIKLEEMSHQTGFFQESRKIIRYLHRGDFIKRTGDTRLEDSNSQKRTEVT